MPVFATSFNRPLAIPPLCVTNVTHVTDVNVSKEFSPLTILVLSTFVIHVSQYFSIFEPNLVFQQFIAEVTEL